jgi:hypothetical protein
LKTLPGSPEARNTSSSGKFGVEAQLSQRDRVEPEIPARLAIAR